MTGCAIGRALACHAIGSAEGTASWPDTLWALVLDKGRTSAGALKEALPKRLSTESKRLNRRELMRVGRLRTGLGVGRPCQAAWLTFERRRCIFCSPEPSSFDWEKAM